MKRILVIEDDRDLLLGLKDNLELEGYEVMTAGDGEQGLARAVQSRPDAIILDLMLPGLGGFDVCRSLRDRGLHSPVLMLSARGQETDKMRGLELGADDYVTKPFSIVELLARIRALIRRASGPPATLDVYQFGNVELNFRLLRARRGKRTVPLSGLEFEVLRYLVLRRGETVSREQLLHDVWGYQTSPVTRSVDNVVARLRHKLETHPDRPWHILTVHGTGYRFVD
jgi:two-component system alkaline phosphatase synthesis response regulator PhoP